MKTFVGIAILICLMFYIDGASAATTYKSYVDYDYGFYKVIGTDEKPATDKEPARVNFTTVNYTNKTLTINAGDTVVWINYDPKDWPITIVSEQGLWKHDEAYLKYSYRKFNHTFTEPGTYNVYIKENDKLHQTIVVNPIVTPISTRIVETPESIDTPATTPEMTTTPIKTPVNATPVINAVGTIMVVLLALYFLKRH